MVGVSRAGRALGLGRLADDSNAWLDGVADSKIADFAGEAAAADAGVMCNLAPLKAHRAVGVPGPRRIARAPVEQAGGFDAELADIKAVAAHHANNYMPLVARHRR